MRAVCVLLFIIGTLHAGVNARGFIFGRFRPNSPNYGYDTGSSDRWTPREHILQSLLGSDLLEDGMCEGRRCSSNDHCCSGHICVSFSSDSGGTCLAAESHRKSYECESDLDCSVDQVCELGICGHAGERKGYNELCMESAECATNKGLCCQLVRKHRQAPKKVCAYYNDPMNCLGHVDSFPIKRMVPAH